MKLADYVETLRTHIDKHGLSSSQSNDRGDGPPAARYVSLPVVTGPLMSSFRTCTRALVVSSLSTGCYVGFQSKQTNGKWPLTNYKILEAYKSTSMGGDPQLMSVLLPRHGSLGYQPPLPAANVGTFALL